MDFNNRNRCFFVGIWRFSVPYYFVKNHLDNLVTRKVNIPSNQKHSVCGWEKKLGVRVSLLLLGAN